MALLGVSDPLPPDALDGNVFGKLLALEAEEPGFLAELVREFQQGVVRRLLAMRAAVEGGDGEALAFAAHSLRGSCGTIGARRMALIAGRLEDTPSAAPETVEPLLRQLEAEYEAVRHALDAAVGAARTPDPRP
jgi:two-component system sensor histidine kinase/response regulator